MMIRKIFLLSLLLVLTVFFSLEIDVFGQNTQFKLPKAGITPDSFFYFLDSFLESLQEFFTFNPEGKAHLQITFAAERIAEIKVLLERKGVEAKGLDIAQSKLRAHLAKAVDIISDQKAKGKDVSNLAKELDDKFDEPKFAQLKPLENKKKY